MDNVSLSMIESIAADAYNEFYNNNKDLFKSDIQEYWFLASKFKDEKVRDEKYAVKCAPDKYTPDKDYDPTEDIYLESSRLIDSLKSGKKHNFKHKLFSLF